MQILTDLNMMKNQIKNFVLHKLSSAPSNPAQAQVYFDTTEGTMKFYDGSAWKSIPTALSQLTDDATHRVVTDTEKSDWNGKASLASPTFTGTPKAPTAGAGTNNTQIATTAFVKTAINNSVTSAISSNY